MTAAVAGAQEPAPDSAAKPKAPPKVRRIPLTTELENSAFRDQGARALLTRARTARLSQDSALRAYDARSYLRVSVGMRIARLGPERLLFRTEHSGRVRWTRPSGVWIETTGRRSLVPMGDADVDLSEATPVPYFPGREALWMPSGSLRVVSDEVNENDLLHPLARGAEAYYHYKTGDSIQIRLPDGRQIQLRELEITARRPEWRAFVGSFWFDTERGSLVRAAYRSAGEIDMWQEIGEEGKRQVEELEQKIQTDTGQLAVEARKRMESIKGEGRGVRISSAFLSPMKARISGITVEYGLYEGRFWLPKRNVFEGEGQAMFIRIPIRYEESYRYTSVNGDETLAAVPVVGDSGFTADDTLYVSRGFITIGSDRSRIGARDTASEAVRREREDSVMRYRVHRGDSLRTVADSLEAAKGDTVRINSLRLRSARNRAINRSILRRREDCARDSTYFAGTSTMYDGALRIAIRYPCDTSKLAVSEDLPASILSSDDQLFSSADRDQLLEGLDFSLQPGWGPQPPRFHTGLDLLRYNRVEGLSVGASLTSVLGLGYTAQAVARFGFADHTPNGELSLSRSNGRSDITLRAFHRLAVANDDWGSPLSFGASVANMLYARDEGFYYRSWGAELGGTRDAPGPMSGARMRWRLFAERQYNAGATPRTQASLGKWISDARFSDNIAAQQLVAAGLATEFARSFGIDPRGIRFDSKLRMEAAATNSDVLGAGGYGRLVLDGTASRPFGRWALAITGAGGASGGDVPVQRAFYVGGLHTVRGQFAHPSGEGRVGDSFWMGRAELGSSFRALRPSLFYDIGWAGMREDIAKGRPLSGAGIGLSILDGLFRLDVARGIYPEKGWRTDLHIGARF